MNNVTNTQPLKAPSQTMLMQLLLSGERYTTRQLCILGKVSDPRKTIQMLRKKGVPILDEWETNSEGRRYKEYFIDPNGIDFARQWREFKNGNMQP